MHVNMYRLYNINSIIHSRNLLLISPKTFPLSHICHYHATRLFRLRRLAIRRHSIMTVRLHRFGSIGGHFFLVLCVLGWCPASVGLGVEVREEVIEENGVGEGEVEGPAGVATVVEEELGGVDEGQAELQELQGSDVLLPPEVLLPLVAQRCQGVVAVHDDVHEGVDGANEGAMTPGVVLGGPPGYHGHDCVVVHVQERDLVVLLAQDEEDRVEQFTDLGEEVDVHAPGYPHGGGAVGEVHGLTLPAVVGPGCVHGLPHEPHADSDLHKVVHDEYVAQVQGLPVGHEPRPGRQNEVEPYAYDSEARERTAQQRPVVCSFVSEFSEEEIIVSYHRVVVDGVGHCVYTFRSPNP